MSCYMYKCHITVHPCWTDLVTYNSMKYNVASMSRDDARCGATTYMMQRAIVSVSRDDGWCYVMQVWASLCAWPGQWRGTAPSSPSFSHPLTRPVPSTSLPPPVMWPSRLAHHTFYFAQLLPLLLLSLLLLFILFKVTFFSLTFSHEQY